MSDAVLGAVLVGGSSRRMGTDKARLALDGTPMAHLVERALFDGGAGTVVLVGGGADSNGNDDRDGAVADRWPGEGPLGGLATAVLHGAGTDGIEIVVVAACDQPDLSAELIASLSTSLHGAPPQVVGSAVRTPDGRRHPFPSAWRTRAGEALAALVEAGERRADAGFGLGPIVEVIAPAETVDDLDTPAEVERWTSRRHEAEHEPPENRT